MKRYVIPQFHRNFSGLIGKKPSSQAMCRVTMDNVSCRRCGNFHSSAQLCKALTRLCYVCRRYGHYANMCMNKTATRTTRKEASPTNPLSDNKIIHQRQVKASKPEHNSEFNQMKNLDRQSVCLLMPFNNESNEELSNLGPRNSCINIAQNCTNIGALQEENLKLLSTVNSLKAEIQQLQAEKDSSNIGVLREDLCNLTDINKKLNERVQKLQKVIKAMKQDVVHLSSEACREAIGIAALSTGDTSFLQRKFDCDTCGSNVFHYVCAAYYYQCLLCKTKGHYSSMCPVIKKRCVTNE